MPQQTLSLYPTTPRSKQKRYNPYQQPGTLSMTGGLAPLPYAGNGQQPMTPAPTNTMGSYGALPSQMAPQPVRTQIPVPQARAGDKSAVTWVQQGQGWTQMPNNPNNVAMPQFMNKPTKTLPQGVSPNAQPTQITDYSAYQSPEAWAQALQMSPEAYKHMSPEGAAWLQAQSEMQAQQKNEGIANSALDLLTGQAQGTNQVPGYGNEYWTSMQRSQEGQIRAQFDAERQQLKDMAQRGVNSAYLQRQWGDINSREQAAILKAGQDLNRTRFEQGEQARLNRAGQLTNLANIAPYQGQSWTSMEDYLAGAKNDALLQQMGLATYAQAGRGGGGGGATGVPAMQDFGGAVASTPNLFPGVMFRPQRRQQVPPQDLTPVSDWGYDPYGAGQGSEPSFLLPY